MFRLLFGASTLAAAATLAVFMGGLGLGGWLLGRRVEAHPRPLAFYGGVEILIGVLAAASVGFLGVASWVYHATGGSQVLGTFGATSLRLVLATLVMGPSAVLMGATMPAAARVVTGPDDGRRDGVAVIIGVNTFGAVTGVLLTTFFLFEVLGTTDTLYCAALLNVLVGMTALRLARTSLGAPVPAPVEVDPVHSAAPAAGVIAAAGLVGFAFMLMELVWYRMLSPILGGSTYTFGLVLAVALLGIGLGGGLYAFFGRGRSPTIAGLALTCAAEALALVLPLFLGDRIALLAAFARQAAVLGFPWLLAGWGLVCLLVVFPAALISGYQFSLLIGLLGHGRAGVGREVGLTYAANTFGSIIGALAGGFGLIPALGAVGAWRLAAGALLLVAIAALLTSARRAGFSGLRPSLAALVFGVLTVPCLLAEGPTAVWRHGAIGAGRMMVSAMGSVNQVKDVSAAIRRKLLWERDGVESSVAMVLGGGLAFIVNGKSDGNAIGDSGTQVMGGLIGAALHPSPRTALVIGLGTGSTAGWLAQVSTMEHVDVAEIEPVILDVARDCHEVNHEVLSNPKVSVHLEDARELMLTASSKYDIIFSEPSNPYRAGIASLYTREFYGAAREHLAPGGVLLQWLQGYEVDPETVRTVLVTLGNVFPFVEVWQTQTGDLVLRAMEAPPRLDSDVLRARLKTEPYLSGMRVAWAAEGLEEFMAHFLSSDALTRALVEQYPDAVNSDDLNFVEFAFAQSVGKSAAFSADSMRRLASSGGADRPGWLAGPIDWSAVAETRFLDQRFDRPENLSPEGRARVEAVFAGKGRRAAVAAQKAQPFVFSGPKEEMMMASIFADEREEGALELTRGVEGRFDAEAAVITAGLRLQQRDYPRATEALVLAIQHARRQVWVASPARFPEILQAAARGPIARDQTLAGQLFAALEGPFPAYNFELERREARVILAGALGSGACLAALKELEPHVPWEGASLRRRLDCYRQAGDPLAEKARADLEAFFEAEPAPLAGPMVPEDRAAPLDAGTGAL